MKRRSLDLRRLVKKILAVPFGAQAMNGCPCPEPITRVEQVSEGFERTREGAREDVLRSLVRDECERLCGQTSASCDVEVTLRGGDVALAAPRYVCLAFDIPEAGTLERRVLEGPSLVAHPTVVGLRTAPCEILCEGITSSSERAQTCSLTGPLSSLRDHTVVCAAPPETRLEQIPCGAGRVPPGLVADAAAPPGADPACAYWRAMARLERASVDAFVGLAGDLAALGAPPSLVRRARAAAEDERRHADVCEAALRALGEEPAPVVVGPRPLTELLSLALDNAREGCAREAFGALVVAFQAEHAEDAALRGMLAEIADDEIAHGQLAWDVHTWATARLGPRDARSVEAALDAELARVVRDAAAGAFGTTPAHRRLGLPEKAVAHALAAAFAEAAR